MRNKNEFFQVFKDNNYSLTLQRKKILNFILMKDSHMTIQGICNELNDPEVSQATIYRNLKLFLKLGLVNKVNIESYDYYEIVDRNEENHFHLICKKCHKIIEIKDISTKAIEGSIKEKFAFKVTKSDIVFNGICMDCQNKGDDDA